MTKEEHQKVIESIRTAESDVDRNNLLLQLSKDYQQVTTSLETTTLTNNSLKSECDEFAKLNNSLMIQLSGQKIEESTIETTTENHQEPPRISYDDLTFD